MKQVDREIGDMISSLTRRLAHLQKKSMDGANTHHHQEEMDEEEENRRAGVGIITMAGTNEGATMRGEITSMDQDDNSKSTGKQDQSSPLTSYLNNNVQSVNNSIMVGGSYSANDPGIHLEVDDHYQGKPTRYGNKNNNNNNNKNKESSSGSSTSDHSS